jgi:hypothetical protein
MSIFKKMIAPPINAQYLKFSEAVRDQASVLAMDIVRASQCHPGIPDALDAHVSLMLQAIAAEHMAYGRETLAKHYLASAMRIEASALVQELAAISELNSEDDA